jgi:hypothetical protein
LPPIERAGRAFDDLLAIGRAAGDRGVAVADRPTAEQDDAAPQAHRRVGDAAGEMARAVKMIGEVGVPIALIREPRLTTR